jgi:uncharacterized protein (TIRG00374 family)
LNAEKILHLLRRYLYPLLLISALGLGGWYIATHGEELAAVRSLSPGWVLLLFGLAVVKLISMGAFTKIIVGCFGVKLSFLEWFGLSAMSAMGNYLTPFQGGVAVRAVYLKSRHRFPYASFLSTLSTLYVLTFSTSAALGLLAMLGLYLRLGFFDGTPVFLFLAILCLPAVIFALARLMPSITARLEKWEAVDNPKTPTLKRLLLRCTSRLAGILDRVAEGWRIISTHRNTLTLLILVSLLNAGVTLLMIHFSFMAFRIELPLLESLVLSSLFMVSSMLPITPSGLGIAEVLIVLTAQGFVDNSSLSSLSAGLNRSVMIISSIVWGVLFSYILGQQAASAREEDRACEGRSNPQEESHP